MATLPFRPKTTPPLRRARLMLPFALPFALPVVLALAVARPAAAAPAAIVPVEDKAPLLFPDGTVGRPAFLRTVKTRFDSPGIVGELGAGFFCARKGDIVWEQKATGTLLPIAVMQARFRTALERAHYPVPPQSDALFAEKKDDADPKDGRNVLQVGILVKNVAVNLCAKGTNQWTGEAHLQAYWQVFAPEMQKVVFETTTEGGFSTRGDPVSGPASVVMGEAFSVATRNLLADPGFLRAVSTPQGAPLAVSGASGVAAATSAHLTIEGAPPTAEPLAAHVTMLRAAVATVFGDTGSGSGFFVGTSGLLLTNQHVVGNAKFVKVRMATGRELVGEVQRVDRVRDVALVKTEPTGVPPIPVRLTDPGVGEEVYALGSPLGDAFNTTLTRGIVSGVRELGNQPFLQSDVAILPGNSGGPLLDKSGQVVGITVMGLGAKGVAGMNFFIPVGDALSKLDAGIVAGH